MTIKDFSKYDDQDELPQTFTCVKCDTAKPISDFYAMPRSKRGHHKQCKACIKVYNAANAAKNAKRSRDWNKGRVAWLGRKSPEFQEKYKKKHAAYAKRYYDANKEQCLETRRKYREANKELLNKKALQRYHDNREECQAKANARYQELIKDHEYVERRKAASREYVKKNGAKIREQARAKYHERMEDPEYRAAKNAYQRGLYHKLKAERDNVAETD